MDNVDQRKQQEADGRKAMRASTHPQEGMNPALIIRRNQNFRSEFTPKKQTNIHKSSTI